MSQNFLKDFLKDFLNIQGRPSMKLWSVYLTCIGILVLTTSGGCAQSEGESRDLLNIQLFNILGKGLPETFPPAQSMRVIAVTLPEGDAKPAHILLESLWPITTTGQQILESLPEDQPMMLLFEGLDGGNQPLFSGGVGPIEIQSTTGKISEHLIFLSEIGSINPAMTLAEDNTWTAATFEDATLRAGHTAVTLADGRALIIGGGAIDPQGPPPQRLRQHHRLRTQHGPIFSRNRRSQHSAAPQRSPHLSLRDRLCRWPHSHRGRLFLSQRKNSNATQR